MLKRGAFKKMVQQKKKVKKKKPYENGFYSWVQIINIQPSERKHPNITRILRSLQK